MPDTSTSTTPPPEALPGLDAVRHRINNACAACGRQPSEVKLMVVTKTQPPARIAPLLALGHTLLGENRVQEALEKIDALPATARWELIGHLQSNKARLAATHFARIQSADRPKLFEALARARAEAHLGPLPILLQINAGDDPAKFGAACNEAPRLLEAALAHPLLDIQGLMTIAPLSPDPAVAAACFERLRLTRDNLQSTFKLHLPELSMGMSGDLEAAIAAGSTLVRIGTAIFGPRDSS